MATVKLRSAISILIGGTVLGTVTAILTSFALACREPDYTAHLNGVYQLLHGSWFPLPYSGIVGSYVLTGLLMKVLGLTFHQVSSILVWTSQYLGLGALYLVSRQEEGRSARHAWIAPVVAYLVASLLLMNMMLARGYLPQLYSWALYAWAYAFFFTLNRQGIGLLLLLCAGVTYPDGLMWMLPVFAANLRLADGYKKAALGVSFIAVFFLIRTQLRYSVMEGAANMNWFASGLAPSFALLCGVFFLQPREANRPLKQILALYCIIAGGLALHNQLSHMGVKYYARKNFYFIGILAPLILAHRPSMRRLRLAWSAAGLLTVAAAIELNGSGVDVIMPDLLRGYPPFDQADERLALKLRSKIPDVCQRTVVLPRYQSYVGMSEDPYLEITTRVLGYNAIFNGFPRSGGVALTGLGSRYANIYEVSKILWQTKDISLRELGVMPATCTLASTRLRITDAAPIAAFDPEIPNRESFTLYLPVTSK